MGFFGLKKKDERIEKKLPEFPRFPEPAKLTEQLSAFPAYEQTFVPPPPKPVEVPQQPPQTMMIQEPVMRRPVEIRVDIPRREPAFLRQEPVYPERQAQGAWKPPPPPPVPPAGESSWAAPPRAAPLEEKAPLPPQPASEERPVFVKIKQYREAMESIEMLKQKLREIEFILEKLGEIRNHEQEELKNCQENVNKIKEKLIEVDKKLFEV